MGGVVILGDGIEFGEFFGVWLVNRRIGKAFSLNYQGKNQYYCRHSQHDFFPGWA